MAKPKKEKESQDVIVTGLIPEKDQNQNSKIKELESVVQKLESKFVTLNTQKNITVKFKKLHKDAELPTYIEAGSAGLDIKCVDCEYDVEHDAYIYHTGLAVEIPKGYVGLLFPKSGIFKKEMMLCNHVGVCDSSYRGEVKAMFKITKKRYFKTFLDRCRSAFLGQISYHKEDLFTSDEVYANGDKIIQLIIIPYPKINVLESEELEKTERGEKGFGEMDEITIILKNEQKEIK